MHERRSKRQAQRCYLPQQCANYFANAGYDAE